MTVRRSLTWLVPLALLVVGCGEAARDEARDPAQRPSGTESSPVMISCGGPDGWAPSATVHGIEASVSDEEIRDGFRQLLADPQFSGELSLSFLHDGADDTQFHVLAEHGSTVTLALGKWTRSGPERGAYLFSITRGQHGWAFAGGASCPKLSPVLTGGREYSWVELSAPDGGIDRSSTDVPIGVTEVECTGARDPLPHLNEPEVVADSRTITVYWTSRRDAPAGQAFSCPGPMPTMTTLPLDEPLGDRQLLDGSVYPPRPVR